MFLPMAAVVIYSVLTNSKSGRHLFYIYCELWREQVKTTNNTHLRRGLHE